MTNEDGQSSASPSAIPVSRHRIPRLSTPRSSSSYGSYGSYGSRERGEPSAAGGIFLHDVATTSTTLARSSGRDFVDRDRFRSQTPDNDGSEVQKKRRSFRPRSSGGFLLSNVFSREHDIPKLNPFTRDDSRRASKIPVSNGKGKTPLDTSDRPDSAPASTRMGLGIGGQDVMDDSRNSPSHLSPIDTVRDRSPSQRRTPPTRIPSPSPRPTTPSLDLDSTQIVNMALNLSESRRLASRRYVSTPVPPRLSPVLDDAVSGSLKQHLQQQRRTSRTISPMPDHGHIVKNVSGHRLSGPLQPAFEPEGTYTYHFSSSTIDRAQKAKEHLELMAQYRRLLQFLPPLKPDALNRSRPSTSDPSLPSTVSRSSSNTFINPQQPPLGRPYNPLQYIRNRRVRARERKTIDGETLGFGDVMKVTDWVDETATAAANSPLSPRGPLPPAFSGAQELGDDRSNTSNIPRPTSSLGKVKRPRLDWSINPADMLADAYWLEQDDNKYLIEDRHHSRIFPPRQESQRPLSRQASEPVWRTVAAATELRANEEKNPRLSFQYDAVKPIKGESDISLSSARDRARQKLHDLRGSHKRSNSIHAHDFLRFRRSSLSDSSDADSDRRRRDRSGTLTIATNLLDKQMMEMLAREALEEQKENASDVENKELKTLAGGMVTPDKIPPSFGNTRSPKESSPAPLESPEKAAQVHDRQVPYLPGRPSLEVPAPNYRPSLDIDSSVPASPDLGPSHAGNSFLPTIGMDLSPPSSRPGSPARKPFSKVKNIFRDRSRERGSGHEKETKLTVPEKERNPDSPVEPSGEPLLTPPVTAERPQSLDLPRPASPGRHLVHRATNPVHKPHRSVGSIRFKSEDSLGLRSIFKGGAKIDGIIREGVSKVGDLIWRKDSERDDSSTTTTDESDAEQKLNKPMESAVTKSDSLLHLRSVSESMNGSTAQDNTLAIHRNPSRATSPRPDRFDKLKPPPIDVRGTLPSLSPVISPGIRHGDGVPDGGLRSPALSVHQQKDGPKRDPTALTLRSREWSVVSDRDRSASPSLRRTQVSKREVARLRALILGSGIMAMEIARRAQEPQPLFLPAAVLDDNSVYRYGHKNAAAAAAAAAAVAGTGLSWQDVQGLVAILGANEAAAARSLSVRQAELFPATARVLEQSADRSLAALRTSATLGDGDFYRNRDHETTATATSPPMPASSGLEAQIAQTRQLQRRGDALLARLAADLSERARRCADDADDVGRDLLAVRRLEVKRATDAMDKMLRRRRRRFRWARRAGWLALEYMLVGLMWYVWFVVVVGRVVVGLGRGLWRGLRWLFWL